MNQDAVEIYVEGSSVFLKKYKASCIFRESSKDITDFKGENTYHKDLEEPKKP
ncbi:MAG: hypothetical protein Q4B50_03350 [Bacillota bacterium]|nr:hypothetical protein [Bacillota bacterium]